MAAWAILGIVAAVILLLIFGVIGFTLIKAAWEYTIERLF